LSPIIADPAVLTPADSPDGRWHLFAHSLRGIHHHVSLDGVRWRRLAGVAVRGGMRPHLTVAGGRYLMAYERPQVFMPVGLPWRSRIEASWSDDLLTWGEPAVLLEPSLRWHERGRSRSVGNPCLVRSGGGWRLWYSAGLVRLPDCGFDEPAWIGAAHSDRPDGGFRPDPDPVLGPEVNDPAANLAAGALKAYRVADGWVGLQNPVSWDPVARRSSSAIRVLCSADGARWEQTGAPILGPAPGWRASHLYQLDLAVSAGVLRLYANGRTAAPWWRGVERIGLFEARMRPAG
jgi:hypothetical protein